MRCLMKVAILGTRQCRGPRWQLGEEDDRTILADLKPELAYFAGDNGKPAGFIFFDLKDRRKYPPWRSRGFWFSMLVSSSIRL